MVVGGEGGVVVGAVVGGGVGVDDRGGEAGDGVDETVLSLDSDGVGGDSCGAGVDEDVALGPELVADPAHADLAGAQYAGDGGQGRFGLVDEGGVDGIHEPAVDLAGGRSHHGQDGDRDEQADDGVGLPPAQGDAARAGQAGQGGEAVGAGVRPVGDEGARADLAAGADPVAGDPLVAEEPDQRGDGHGDQVSDLLGVDQPVDGGPGGGHGRGRDDQDDHDAGQVLGPAVAVGVAAGG